MKHKIGIRRRHLEERFYDIALMACAVLSTASIVGNVVTGFPHQANVKWFALLVISGVGYTLSRLHKDGPLGRALFFGFLVFVFLPLGFIDSGGSANNALGYAFTLVVGITYLFRGRTRMVLVIGLIVTYQSLLLLEYFNPQVLNVHSEWSQFLDRFIQVPLQLTAIFTIILSFADSVHSTHTQLVEERTRLEEISVTDSLTGLANRAKLDQVAASYLEEAVKNSDTCRGMAIIILDVDGFKEINDRFGHQTGDRVLAELAGVLRENVRKGDVVGRWGGEEFMVILRDCVRTDATVVAETLRQAIRNNVFSDVGTVTASFGSASLTPGETITSLVRRADRALYRAKEDGKNRVQVADGEAQQKPSLTPQSIRGQH